MSHTMYMGRYSPNENCSASKSVLHGARAAQSTDHSLATFHHSSYHSLIHSYGHTLSYYHISITFILTDTHVHGLCAAAPFSVIDPMGQQNFFNNMPTGPNDLFSRPPVHRPREDLFILFTSCIFCRTLCSVMNTYFFICSCCLVFSLIVFGTKIDHFCFHVTVKLCDERQP